MNQLVGHQLRQSPEINQLVKNLVQAVETKNSSITGVRPPSAATNDGPTVYQRIQQVRGRPLTFPYVGSGAGNGPYAELEDGRVVLDLINGIGIHLFGHSNPRVMEASIRGAMSDICIQGHLEPNREYLEFSELLVKLASRRSRLKYAWVSTCGTIANENALKMTRQKHTPARFVLALENAFAGRSTMMAEITDNKDYKQGLPNYEEILRVPFYDKKNPAASTEKALNAIRSHVEKHKGQISTFVFEPMLGEGGYRHAPREFYVPLFEYLKQNQIAVWADEVQTFSRTGELFAFETLDIGNYVDIVTIAKTALVGATLYTEEYNPKPGLVAGTFAGSTACLSAGIEILKMLTEEGYLGPQGKIQKIHQEFVGMLNELNETTCKGLLTDAGGLGLMVAVTPFDGSKDKTNQLQQKLFQNGLMCFGCGHDPYRLRFLIPAVLKSEHIKVAKQIFEKTVLEMK